MRVQKMVAMLVRAVVLLAVLSAALPGHALAADVVTLTVAPATVAYGAHVQASGTVEPAVPNESVGIYGWAGGRLTFLTSTTTDALGAFSGTVVARRYRVFVAQARDDAGNPVRSDRASVRIRPRIVAHLRGSRRIGAHLFLSGRMLPRSAGTLTLTDGVRVRRVRVGAAGRFSVELSTTGAPSYRATLRLRPAPGYVGWQTTRSVRIRLPPLAFGARGAAVAALQTALRLGGYALPGISSVFDSATADAVLAFQKVHGLPLTGAVTGRFWTVVGSTGRPHARIPFGDHVEVDKTRQLLFEVRAGRVVSVARVSTGATGNTPVGHWRVYAKGPGFNAKGMYDSLFFLRGFAIHGYASVPTYPASHGCVRTPLWFAPGFYARWSIGASVYVFA